MRVISAETKKEMQVGGQAVIEGVMMRSPNSFTVSVRTPEGGIVIREDRWHSVWKKLKFLRWPFFRGMIVLIEALWNGISSLSFSAKWAGLEDDDKKDGEDPKPENESKSANEDDAKPVEPEQPISDFALVLTIMFSFTLAIGLFVALPHALAALFGLEPDSWDFHALDGVIKLAILILYVWGISFIPDINRVFQYHGAEHMSIFAWENKLPLTVESARKFKTHHPRCGTSFLFLVLMVSFIVFIIIFPFLPKLPEMPKILRHLVYICIKIPLMAPIAGISYELVRLAGKYSTNPIMRAISMPGLALQRITTKTPTDDQLEIALLSLKKCLWREGILEDSGNDSVGQTCQYENFDEASEAIAKG